MHSSKNESDSICPQPTLIPTDEPENEVWHYIEHLTSLSYVRKLLKCHRGSNFHNFGPHIQTLSVRKQDYNKQNKHKRIQEIIYTDVDIEQNALEITLLTRQSIELYKASQLVSIYPSVCIFMHKLCLSYQPSLLANVLMFLVLICPICNG